MDTICAPNYAKNSEVKTWQFTSNFPNRKSFWHMKGMNILSGKMLDYNHGDVRNRVFAMSKKLNMDELSTIMYLMNRMSQKMGL